MHWDVLIQSITHRQPKASRHSHLSLGHISNHHRLVEGAPQFSDTSASDLIAFSLYVALRWKYRFVHRDLVWYWTAKRFCIAMSYCGTMAGWNSWGIPVHLHLCEIDHNILRYDRLPRWIKWFELWLYYVLPNMYKVCINAFIVETSLVKNCTSFVASYRPMQHTGYGKYRLETETRNERQWE